VTLDREIDNDPYANMYRLVYVFFVDGSYRVFKVSQYMKLVFNIDYLASDYIRLYSSGPGKEQNVTITIASNKTSIMGIAIFVLQYMIVLGLAGGIIGILLFWQHSRPHSTEKYDFELNEPNKEDNIEERLITKNNEDGIEITVNERHKTEFITDPRQDDQQGNGVLVTDLVDSF
jgi:hypothetical protein